MSETYGWLTTARRRISAASYRLSLTPRVLPAQRFVCRTRYLRLLRCKSRFSAVRSALRPCKYYSTDLLNLQERRTAALLPTPEGGGIRARKDFR